MPRRGYRKRILEATGPGFTPLMTCYLTDETSPDELARGFSEGVWLAAKLYPAGATTNSASGVTNIRNIYPSLARMEKIGMVLCVHGEVTDPDVDVFDRETVFIERILSPLVEDFPALKIVLEHITTEEAVALRTISRAEPCCNGHSPAPDPQPQCDFRGRVTASRLLPSSRQARKASSCRTRGGNLRLAQILPRHRQRAACAPSQGKRLWLRRSLQRAVCARKLCDVFEEEGALDKLEIFASVHGPAFYGLPLNEGTVTLERAKVQVPAEIDGIVPFHAGETLRWRLLA